MSEASTTDLRQLSAAAAHEIRNPLNTMAIHCELLESRLRRLAEADAAPETDQDTTALLRSVSVLRNEVDRIDRTLDHFLRHAGPPEADREAIDADAWLAQVVAAVQDEHRGVTIRLTHAPLGRWNVDGVTLGRAVQAVLENAALATPPGGVVEVNASSDGERGVIEIRDRGPGIAPEVLPQIFQLGFSTRRGHAGLGLAIAKQVVKSQHGGDLQVRSVPHEGTVVTLGVPLEDDDDA